MSSLQIIENKISTIQKYLSILDRYKRHSRIDLENDVDIRGATERYLYLAVQSVIDCAEAVIAYKKFRKPTTMSDTFYILHEEGVLSLEAIQPLIQMTGFRNIIVHGYERINYDVVYDVLHHHLLDIEKFLEKIKEYCKV
ncbi:DUF86 domain-containing protein [Candidatus Uhrbacteria bacterium]|nr:DUF86 domain-containing protein [Candidatus Uhrbacteria bacterium]